ncbi:kinase-like domain-containing protein [Gorgonomyces haynaldii]|nr:kinase-like domain-containing protein [Gorgonomyces haynaldii]
MVTDDIVLGFQLYDDIGEGGHARVRLGFNPTTQQTAAVKILPKKVNDQKVDLIGLQKEVRIHSAISHRNIIKLFGAQDTSEYVYLVLEYCEGGELFDKIEPDLGIPEQLAHFYFVQLMNCLEYLHKCGIAHRDLKPENMLLDKNGNLKLGDFGLATVFRHKNKTRKLTTPCIILFVLLAGNTAWAEPTRHDLEFQQYISHYPLLEYAPWNRFTLLLSILNTNPEQRITMTGIRQSQWILTPNELIGPDGLCTNPKFLAEQLAPKQDNDFAIAYSQPSDLRVDASSPLEIANMKHQHMSFSQPIHPMSDSPGAETLSQVKRSGMELFPNYQVTRFFSMSEPSDIFERLTQCLEQFLVPYKIHTTLLKISFSTVDRRKCQLHGEITIQPVDSETYMVSFRKSKGDPIEFKRFYRSLYDAVGDIVAS